MDPIIRHVRAVITQPAQDLPSNLPDGIDLAALSQAKYIQKPWGFELWLSDATKTPFALKLIHLKAGTKTSLQYHEKKKECNCLLTGSAKLHYESSKTKSIVSVVLNVGDIIHIFPPTLHRIEAITDVLLVEASTQELDDVIRVADDYERPDGKIDSEHASTI